MSETFKQYRAVYKIKDFMGTPIVIRSEPLSEPDSSKLWDLSHLEESWAYDIRWEEREVVAGDWAYRQGEEQ